MRERGRERERKREREEEREEERERKIERKDVRIKTFFISDLTSAMTELLFCRSWLLCASCCSSS